MIAALLLAGWCASGPGAETLGPGAGFPDELIGVWRTDAPAYAGRSLSLGPSRVVIGRGDAGPAVYVVREVERLPVWRGRSYLIRYVDTDGELNTLEVSVLEDGTMRLRNPPDVVWRRR